MVELIPPRRFLMHCTGRCPIAPEKAIQVAIINLKCKCGRETPINLNHSIGGALIFDGVEPMVELFEKVGTSVSISSNDVMAGARIKDIGGIIVEWCKKADVGDWRDIPELSATIVRIPSGKDFPKIELAKQEMPKLMLVGGNAWN